MPCLPCDPKNERAGGTPALLSREAASESSQGRMRDPPLFLEM